MSGSLEAGFTGGLAKFSFRALRLPDGTERERDPDSNNMHSTLWLQPAAAERGHTQCDRMLVYLSNFCLCTLEISLYMCAMSSIKKFVVIQHILVLCTIKFGQQVSENDEEKTVY